jgi:hypothetical protein
MNLRAVLFALIALALALPATAADKGTAEFGVDKTGTCRDVAVRDIVLGDWVPIGCINETDHQFRITDDSLQHLLGIGNGNLRVGDDALSAVTPNLPASGYGQNDIAFGDDAMEFSTTANATVAIGTNAGQYFGIISDLVTSDATFSGWTLGTGWAAAGGFATHTPGTASSITKATSQLQDNVPYYIFFTVTNMTAGTIQAKFSGGGTTKNGIVHSANGVFQEPLRAASGNTQAEFAVSSDFDGKISGIIVQTLNGRTGVFVGFNAGQYIGTGPSNTFLGAYCGQGAETDETTGAVISGTINGHPLGGTNNSCVGEASMLHIRSGASDNNSLGYNSLFNLTTGSNNSAFGSATIFEGTDLEQTIAFGNGAYQYGNGAQNTFIGYEAGRGANRFSTLAGTIAIGAMTLALVDGSVCHVGDGLSQNTIFPPGTSVTAVSGNNITVDKAAWNDGSGEAVSTLVTCYDRPTGILNTAIGNLALLNISDGAQFNTAIGGQTGQSLTTGERNTFIGRHAGFNTTTGSSNILIGASMEASSATASSELNIGGTLFGTGIGTGVPTAGKIGVGTAAPAFSLDVAGALASTGDTSQLVLRINSSSAAAPGATNIRLKMLCGTNAGTAKLVAMGGTSTSTFTVLDNIGAGVTGC